MERHFFRSASGAKEVQFEHEMVAASGPGLWRTRSFPAMAMGGPGFGGTVYGPVNNAAAAKPDSA